MRRHLALLLTVPVFLCAAAPARGSARLPGGTGERIRLALPESDPGAGEAIELTAELWVKGFLAENTAPAWRDAAADGRGNVLCEGPDGVTVSLGAGRVRLRCGGEGQAIARLDGVTSVLDGDWHHVAVQRSRADARMEIWVDGALDASGPGPRFARSGSTPPGPRGASLVIGGPADGGAPGELPFSGWVDEVRLSRTRRYDAPFPRPTGRFTPDPDTIALDHLDGSGSSSPAERSAESPFVARGSGGFPAAGELDIEAVPNPDLGQTLLWVRYGDGRDGDVAVDIRDGAGRRAVRLEGTLRHGAAMLVWAGRDDDGRPAAAGVYFARVVGAEREGARIVLP